MTLMDDVLARIIVGVLFFGCLILWRKLKG